MALSPMWTGMILLGSLKNQLQNSAPPLSKIPVQFDFQATKFQGKWYVIGLAGRNIKTEGLGHNKMYATIYQLQADHSYRVISNLIKGESCDIGFRTFVPKGKRGQFALDNFKGKCGDLSLRQVAQVEGSCQETDKRTMAQQHLLPWVGVEDSGVVLPL
ncbi:neutrophil gelatinase-associated lipocalin-like [Trichosurus vulpecula]|uniref:neutrophil gelatinase-associated lipocalin-like n=1 Tax=Trichosurus vulpecula TaxID=9337 RepID=UPI00186B02BB|nr:neutrophil gelatinase-associated lipocalin-like [Trichosurus vulpecula]